jgi:hypothetical protein
LRKRSRAAAREPLQRLVLHDFILKIISDVSVFLGQAITKADSVHEASTIGVSWGSDNKL